MSMVSSYNYATLKNFKEYSIVGNLGKEESTSWPTDYISATMLLIPDQFMTS